MAMMFSQFSSMTLGSRSLQAYTGSQACTPAQKDDTLQILTNNGIVTPLLGSKIQFNLPKQSTIIGKVWIEFTLSAGETAATTAAPFKEAFDVTSAWTLPTAAAPGGNWPRAEYVKNVGDVIVNNHNLVYGNVQLQYIPGAYHAFRRRICCNDVNIEGTNAMVLGALPPSGSVTPGAIVPAVAAQSTEAILVDAFYRGGKIYTPCEEYFWTHRRDEYHMPEALALEQQVQLQLAQLGDFVCTDSRNGSVATITVAPLIQDVRLRYEEITVSATEKENLLKMYATPEGLVQHFLDLELVGQQFIVGTGNRQLTATPEILSSQADLVVPLSLQSLRMDISDLIIVVNRYSNTAAADLYPTENAVLGVQFSGSINESNIQPSLLFEQGVAGDATLQLQGFSTLIPVRSFRILGGTVQLDSSVHTDFWNRAVERKLYFPDSQIAEPIYVRSWSSFPQDSKNSSGHISPSVVGNMGCELVVANPGNTITYIVSFFSKCHNGIQTVRGGRGKLLQ